MKRKTIYPRVHKNKSRQWLKAFENFRMRRSGAARALVKRTSAEMRKGSVIIQYRPPTSSVIHRKRSPARQAPFQVGMIALSKEAAKPSINNLTQWFLQKD